MPKHPRKNLTTTEQLEGEKTIAIANVSGQFDFEQIVIGISMAGQVLVNPSAGGVEQRLILAAEHIEMLGLYRESFPAIADELRNAASAIENKHTSMGFQLFEGLLLVPPRSLASKAMKAVSEVGGKETLLAQYDAMTEAVQAVCHALHQLDYTINASTNAVPKVLGNSIPALELNQHGTTLSDASAMVLGSTLVRLSEKLTPMLGLLSQFRLLGICPKDECTNVGFVDCSLEVLRVYLPVRQFSQYATSDSFKIGDGKTAEVIDGLTERLLEFAKTGKLPEEVVKALTGLLAGEGLKVVVEKWLKGKIGIDAVVAWIMARIGPMLGTAAAGVLAGVIFVSLFMITVTVALAKIYTKVISQQVKRGVLICAKINYRMCVDGICYKYLVTKTVELRITPKSMGIFDTGSDLWIAQELDGNTPENLIIYQYLLDLIARLSAEIAKESNLIKKLELQGKKLAAENQAKKMKKARKFINQLTKEAETSACKVLKSGQDTDTLEMNNFKPCG